MTSVQVRRKWKKLKVPIRIFEFNFSCSLINTRVLEWIQFIICFYIIFLLLPRRLIIFICIFILCCKNLPLFSQRNTELEGLKKLPDFFWMIRKFYIFAIYNTSSRSRFCPRGIKKNKQTSLCIFPDYFLHLC